MPETVTQFDRLWPDPGQVSPTELRETYLSTWPDSRDGAVAMMISSLDGSAVLDGVSGGLSSPADQLLMDLLRSVADVVVVGAGTLRDEGYGGLTVSEDSVAWRTTHGMDEHPTLAVVSAALDLSVDTPFLAQAPTRPIIFTGPDAPVDKVRELTEVADVVVLGSGPGADPELIHDHLADRGYRRVVCEGGPTLLSRWFAAERVAELHLSLAPALTGGGGQRIVHDDIQDDATGQPGTARHTELLQVLRDGSMLMLRQRVLAES
ncbi:pyrimidine reductase family protein [Kocuria soli]|uniref:Pyrimidine reductase family protein n=1 Tax=Kocuria soli TaxID=2485125 RepID=A0A3N3ZNW6_9MICC|nr:dihydrofolate reductase family protein [Kocuria soli]ROZ62625.1 pyrimidine reductase family protein [Kocuria soli]